METNLFALAVASPLIHDLNKQIFDGSNAEKVTALKTDETNVEIWWNGLSEHDRYEVIGLALHYNLTTANSRWGFGEFNTMSKPKQRIIKTVFNKRKESYKAIDLMSMLRVS